MFDTHTGVVIPNTHYFDDILKMYNANMSTSSFDKEIKKYKNFEIQGYKFNYPSQTNFKYYFLTIQNFAKKRLPTINIKNIISITSDSYDNDYIQNVFINGVFSGTLAVDSGDCFSLPFCDKFVSDDFLTNNNVFTPQERAQKVLNIFIQEGWIPKFDDEEITKLARTLIDLHEAWRTDLHTFEHTTRTLFLEKCADESIAAEKGEEWFAEWQKERMQLEEHLLPLMRAGIERVIPVEVVIAAVELLKAAIRDQLPDAGG